MIKEKLDFDQAVKIIEQDIIKVNAGKIINNKNYIVESVFYEEVEEENNPSLDMCFQVFMKDKSKTDKRYGFYLDLWINIPLEKVYGNKNELVDLIDTQIKEGIKNEKKLIFKRLTDVNDVVLNGKKLDAKELKDLVYAIKSYEQTLNSMH